MGRRFSGFVLYFLLFWFITGPGYYAQLRIIEWQSDRIKGVRVAASGGNPDLWLEHIWIEVELSEKRTIRFHDLTLQSVSGDGHIRVSHFGPHILCGEMVESVPVVAGVDGKPLERRVGFTSLDIGPDGEFRNCIECRSNSVRQCVANYDKIITSLDKWPTVNNKGSFMVGANKRFYYWVEPKKR